MDDILHGYSVSEPTWFYLSLLLIIAVFFRFSRVWSLRNFDLLLLLSMSPGLLLVQHSKPWGYTWLFVVTGLLLLRLFCDGLLTRRPGLEQNMNVAGLTFLGVATFAFLMTKVIAEPPPASTVETVRRADHLLKLQDAPAKLPNEEAPPGPATRLLTAPVVPTSKLLAPDDSPRGEHTKSFEHIAASIMAVLAHLAAVCGLIAVGRWHLGQTHIGVAMATIYLLLPCTAYEVGQVNHILPSALIVWTIAAYRRPMIAGSLMGLACGTLLFPVFLLPLWAMFYGRRQALRFGMALGIVAAVLLGSLVLTSADTHSFTRQTIGSIDWTVLTFRSTETAGFWTVENSAYRIPVAVAYLVMLVVLTVWPARKNLEHLLSHSAAIVVGTQFWYPQQGGVYLLWYLPLLLIVVFRPRVAQLLPPQSADVTAAKMQSPKSSGRAATLSGTGNFRQFR